MKISNQINSNNYPNFKGYYVIQIPKKAFYRADNLSEVATAFAMEVNKITKEIHTPFTDKLVSMGIGQKYRQVVGYLEQPKYVQLYKYAKSQGGDIPWLARHMGIEGEMIPAIPNKDYHSFHIYTKDDKKAVFKAKRMNKIMGIIGGNWSGITNVFDDMFRNNVLLTIIENRDLRSRIHQYLDGKRPELIEVKSLSNLKKAFKKIDY